MTASHIHTLAASICVYALFEFVVKRVWWGTGRAPAERARKARARAAWLFCWLLVGTAAFINLRLTIGYALAAGVYAVLESAGGRKTPREAARTSLERFVIKQTLMGVLMYAAWQFALPMENVAWYSILENRVLAHPFALWISQRWAAILLMISAYAFVIDGGTSIVRGILDKFPGLYRRAMLSQQTDSSSSDENENSGEWIGILERVITLTLVLTGNFTAIAFVLTAKSIARFKELENKDFSEYYLLGTMGSVIAAVAAGMAVKLALNF